MGEDLIDLARSILKEVLKEFYYPSIPDPKIVNVQENWVIKFDEGGWRTLVNIWPIQKIGFGEIGRYLKNVWRRVVAYYLVCPYDQATAVKIFTNAIVRSDEFFGKVAANLLIEFVNTSYLYGLYRDEIVWFYRKTIELIDRDNILNSLIFHTLNNLFGKRILGEESRDFLNGDLKNFSLEIYKILIDGGIMNREKWVWKAGEIANKIYRYFKGKKFFDITDDSNIFQRNLAEPIFYKPILSGGKLTGFGIGEVSELLETIFSVEKNIVKVSPAVRGLKIDTKPKDLLRYWYRARAKENVEFRRRKVVKRFELVSNILDNWSITDPVEELDLIASISIFPRPIPNITTKKWLEYRRVVGEEKFESPNLLIVIDSSGSMKFLPGWRELKESPDEQNILKNLGIKYSIGSKFDIALVAAFSALEIAIKLGKKVAAINFSGKAIVCDWTNNREKVEDCLLIFQNDGTEFPPDEVLSLVKKSEDRVGIVIITDAEIYNETETIKCMEEIVNMGHKIYIFYVEEEYSMLIEKAKRIGVEVIQVEKLENLPKQINEALKKIYRF